MNILEAEEKARQIKPPYQYLGAVVDELDEEFTRRLKRYVELKARIFEAISYTDISEFENHIVALEECKWFYDSSTRVMLYKYSLTDENIEHCDSEYNKYESIIEQIKDTIKDIKETTIVD